MAFDFSWILFSLYYEFQLVFQDFGRFQYKDCCLSSLGEHIQTTLPWLTATPAYRRQALCRLSYQGIIINQTPITKIQIPAFAEAASRRQAKQIPMFK